MTHSITLPLMLLGGVLLPMEAAPRWLYAASHGNPPTYLVEPERALFAGQLVSASVLYGVLAAGWFGLLGLWIGSRTIVRATL